MKHLTQVIAELRGGVFNNEASERLRELVERIQESGKKGSISITLTLTPSGSQNRIITVTPKVTAKMPPKPETEEPAIFFAVRGDLVRNDPDQSQLDLDRRRDEREDRERSGVAGVAGGVNG